MKILTAIVTVLLFAAFVSWTVVDVACIALDRQCFDDDPQSYLSLAK